MMMKLHEAAASIGVFPQGGDTEFRAVGTDSRAVTPGMLFVALKGDRFDGHEFVRDVLAAGAVGAVVEHRWAKANPDLPLIPVADTRIALGQLAAHWRARFRLPLLGITGSNGKTTVKEMCAAILRCTLRRCRERAGDRGQPQQRHRPAADAAQAASDASCGGDRDGHEPSGRNRLPDPPRGAHRGVVNNAQRAHLSGLGSVQDVALAKGEIFVGLAADGVAVFNADDAQFDVWRELSRERKQLSFGLDQAADVRGSFSGHGLGGDLQSGHSMGQHRGQASGPRSPQRAQCLRRRGRKPGRRRPAGCGEAGPGDLFGRQGPPAET
jgi:UDP-N-acetylmuramoyl-tripeptide--D-alanyl-D-alanine ligase